MDPDFRGFVERGVRDERQGIAFLDRGKVPFSVREYRSMDRCAEGARAIVGKGG